MSPWQEHCFRSFLKAQLRRLVRESDVHAIDIENEIVDAVKLNFCLEDSRESSGGTNHHQVGQS